MKKNDNKLIDILLILIISAVCMLTITKLCDNDLFFDLRSGKDILRYGLDFQDHFSFIPNLPYLYHHWLYDLIIYFVYKFFNYGGLYILFLIMYIILGISVYHINKKYTHSRLIAFIITIITVLLAKSWIRTRVQTITYVLFFLEIYLLDRLYQTGLKRYTVLLLLISITILNFHMPLWFFSIILTLPFVLEIVLKTGKDSFKFSKNLNSHKVTIESAKNTKQFLITYLLLILSGLVSPYKLQPYTFFLKVMGNNSYNIIEEMQKTALINYPVLIILGLVMLFIIVVLNTKVKLRDLVLFIGLFLFSLIAYRNLAFFAIIVPTLITKILSYNFKISKIELKNKILQIISKFINSLINNKIIITSAIILVILSISLGLKTLNLRTFDFLIPNYYPVESAEYIKKNLDYQNIKLYTDFNYGSYVAFNDIPIFIDSRAEVYLKKFNGQNDILDDYNQADNYFTYKNIFQKYDFDYALVYYNSDLYKSLNIDKDFELLYNEDNYFALFGKKNKE